MKNDKAFREFCQRMELNRRLREWIESEPEDNEQEEDGDDLYNQQG